jgi:hypothetical protein
MIRVQKIISGGQTGADRGGLDAAIALRLVHGGWCPRGRLAEDGRVPAQYQLVETIDAEYDTRTRMNVEAADATVIFVGAMTRGSMATLQWCRRRHRPYVVVANAIAGRDAATARFASWLERVQPAVLNVAGSRESKWPGIHDAVKDILITELKPQKKGMN